MSKSDSSGGIGCGGVLLLIFVVLKLTGLISWSWWWVLSPLWIGLLILVGLVLILLVLSALND